VGAFIGVLTGLFAGAWAGRLWPGGVIGIAFVSLLAAIVLGLLGEAIGALAGRIAHRLAAPPAAPGATASMHVGSVVSRRRPQSPRRGPKGRRRATASTCG
jgi:hypothetical protein